MVSTRGRKSWVVGWGGCAMWHVLPTNYIMPHQQPTPKVLKTNIVKYQKYVTQPPAIMSLVGQTLLRGTTTPPKSFSTGGEVHTINQILYMINIVSDN